MPANQVLRNCCTKGVAEARSALDLLILTVCSVTVGIGLERHKRTVAVVCSHW